MEVEVDYAEVDALVRENAQLRAENERLRAAIVGNLCTCSAGLSGQPHNPRCKAIFLIALTTPEETEP